MCSDNYFQYTNQQINLTMQNLLTAVLLATTATTCAASSSLRAHAEFTPQIVTNYLLVNSYSDSNCFHLMTAATTQMDKCIRINTGSKYKKVTLAGAITTSTTYSNSSCAIVSGTPTTAALIDACTSDGSGGYAMSSVTQSPTFLSTKIGVSIR